MRRPMVTRAGIIPFMIEGTNVKMLFMTPSNSAFGGEAPQIAKGRVERGANVMQTAIKEGEEELGLKSENFTNLPFSLGVQNIAGDVSNYLMEVFAVQVNSVEDFIEPGRETGSVTWMTAEEFHKVGRLSHKVLVNYLVSVLKAA